MAYRAEAETRSSECTREADAAYRHCDTITRRFSKSFYFSTAFLPPPTRRAIRALYAFCRLTDDLVDAPQRVSGVTAGRGGAQEIAEWRRQARLPARVQRHPVLFAWAETRERYQIPHQHIEELIEGCAMDLTVHRYETFEALRVYCYRVASTVGLISMHIIGLSEATPSTVEAAQGAAIELGIALQLTNILRDIGEDLKLGRIYLPQEDLERFHYTEDDLRRGVIDDRFKALMRFEIDRA
ncbi:MAG: phytoene/squalene synthase family protein, partial [Anaerolineae bacterium]|nr:phytoene/squalene synthase family protein [Thermoflexales bacterium]MDW8407480.1 phytoene/squalene synthase family protein [Anaerolineae bacterium]